MPAIEKPSLRCMLLAPLRGEFEEVRRVVKSAASESGVQILSVEEPQPQGMIAERVFAELVRADLVVALVSHTSPNVFYEVGLAHATGKPVIFAADEEAGRPFFDVRSAHLSYGRSAQGLASLHNRLKRVFDDFRREPRQFLSFPRFPTRAGTLPIVDLRRLEPREFENLCFELLNQMGFRRVEWGKELRDIDVVATLPKRDPDGFEYHELWLISMGLHAPAEMFFEMAMHDPEHFVHRILRSDMLERSRLSLRSDTPITLLVIQFRDHPQSEMFEQELRHMERRFMERRFPYILRIRIWDHQQLANLIQQYPQVAYKYFSEEGRAQSKYRKSLEEIYRENVELNERLQATVSALKEERDKRVRAERDAVWKDVAFKAAHKLGNPIFAVETDLQGIKRRIIDRPNEALQVAEEMACSIEKAKTIIEQFKSLTRAQEISPRPIELLPLVKSASRVATENGVEVQITGPEKPLKVHADPTRVTECFDELFANALHWLNKPEKRITVAVEAAKKKDLAPGLDEGKKYVRIRLEDNGCGVAVEKKEEIFAPFYTTYPHGTGLGLSLVQRIVEGHGGVIREVGKPGEGAVFDILLPEARSRDKEA